MVQFVGWYDVDESHTKVVTNVLVGGVGDDFGVSYRVFTFSIDPGVGGSDINILHLLVDGWINAMVKTDSVGPPSKESMARVESGGWFVIGHEFSDIILLILQGTPSTLPNGFHLVAFVAKNLFLGQGGFLHFSERPVTV